MADSNGRGMLTVKEAAAELRLSTSTVRNLITTGAIRRVRYPGCRKVLIPMSQVDRLKARSLR